MVVYYVTRDASDATDEDLEDKSMRARAPFFFVISSFLVVMQCAAVAGIFNGTIKTSCVAADQRQERGTFCHPKHDRCEFCGSDEAVIPPWTVGEDLVHAWDKKKPGYNFTWVVQYCSSNIHHQLAIW